MLRLTRKTDYALVALARLAEQPDQLMSARQLAGEIHAPRALLTGVLKQLQQAGLVNSKRGVHGGYQLASRSDEINVLGVIEAVEGPVNLTLCCGEPEEATTPCSLEQSCQINGSIQRLNERLNAFLADTRLVDLLVEPAPVGARDPEVRSRSSFSIG